MSEHIAPPGQRGILVDANLLVLLLIGSYDPAFIQKFKRTAQFQIEDFYKLAREIGRFDVIITTPNLLTEASNICNQLKSWLKDEVFAIMSQFIAISDEIYIESRLPACDPRFAEFGLTDMGMIHAAKDRYPILTTDGRLASFARSLGIVVVEFSTL